MQEESSILRIWPGKQICSEWQSKFKIQNTTRNTNTNTGRKFSCKDLARQADLLRVTKPSKVWLSAAFCIHKHSKAFLTAFPAQKDCRGTSITLLHYGSSAIHTSFWAKKKLRNFRKHIYVSLHSASITRFRETTLKRLALGRFHPVDHWSSCHLISCNVKSGFGYKSLGRVAMVDYVTFITWLIKKRQQPVFWTTLCMHSLQYIFW